MTGSTERDTVVGDKLAALRGSTDAVIWPIEPASPWPGQPMAIAMLWLAVAVAAILAIREVPSSATVDFWTAFTLGAVSAALAFVTVRFVALVVRQVRS